MAQEVTIDIDEKAQAAGVPKVDPVPSQISGHSDNPDKPPAKPRRRNRLLLAGAAVILLAAAGATAYYFFAGWESTDDAQIDGYVNPISSRIAGYITNVYVDDNQYVKAGTLLAQIDPTDYEVALGSAQATLANDRATADASQGNVPITSVNSLSQITSAQADVDNARAAISGSEKQLAAARAALLQANANNAKAQDDVKRYKPLVDKQEIAEQLYVQAVETANATGAAVEVAAANVQADQDAVTQAQGKYDQAVAALDSARTGPQQVRIQESRALGAVALAEKSKRAVELAGLMIMPGGFALIMVLPLVGFLLSRFDARLMIAFGLVLLATSMFVMAYRFDLAVDFSTMMWARVFQSVSLAFLFIPINTAAYSYLPREKNNIASGLINLFRNIGASVGISFVTTMLARRSQFHQSVLAARATDFSPQFRAAIQGTSHFFMSGGAVTAQQQTYGQFYGSVLRQSNMMAYLDNFWMLGVSALVVIPFVFLMKRPPKGTAAAGH